MSAKNLSLVCISLALFSLISAKLNIDNLMHRKSSKLVDMTAMVNGVPSLRQEAAVSNIEITAAPTNNNVQVMQTVLYNQDNVSIYEIHGFPLDTCICGGGNCLQQTYNSQTASAYVLNVISYAGAANCNGASTATTTKTYPFSGTQTQSMECYAGGGGFYDYYKDVTLKATNTLYSSFSAATTNLGTGGFSMTYSTLSDCQNGMYTGYEFVPVYSCLTEVQNSICYAQNKSMSIIDSTHAVVNQYASKSCDKVIASEEGTLINTNCFYNTEAYETLSFIGGSGSDDDNVSLSKGAYGALVAFVFIALLFGCVFMYALVFFGVLTPRKNDALLNRGSSSSLNNPQL